jgi:hypothetical protein
MCYPILYLCLLDQPVHLHCHNVYYSIFQWTNCYSLRSAHDTKCDMVNLLSLTGDYNINMASASTLFLHGVHSDDRTFKRLKQLCVFSLHPCLSPSTMSIKRCEWLFHPWRSALCTMELVGVSDGSKNFSSCCHTNKILWLRT